MPGRLAWGAAIRTSHPTLHAFPGFSAWFLQEQELAQCTFQPNLGHSHTQRSPAKQGGGCGAPAGGPKPGSEARTSGVPPDVLDQVQALLRGEGTVELAASSTAVPGAAGAASGTGAQQVALAEAAAMGVPRGAQGGAAAAAAAAGGFSAYLSQVTTELRRLQAE